MIAVAPLVMRMRPARKMHHPIRHTWTTAADLLAGTDTYAERFYRTESL
ncbi:hypothetical protein AB0D12_06605 [Streptomyces sp. NPDC048479]